MPQSFLTTVAACFVTLAALTLPSANAKLAELLDYDSVADPAAVIVSGSARFTVLTPELFRCEYAATGSAGKFEDRPTLAVVNRKTPVPTFTHAVSSDGKTLTITTKSLTLTYAVGQAFSPSSLTVAPSAAAEIKAAKSANPAGAFQGWAFGDRASTSGNLFGTIFGLDMQGALSLNCTDYDQCEPARWEERRCPCMDATFDYNTPCPCVEKQLCPTNTIDNVPDKGIHNNSVQCTYGLVSKGGWSVHDDVIHNQQAFDEENDFWGGANTDAVDIYVLAHGQNYKAALKDWTLVGGKVPVPPRYTLGTMWSRWYDLSQQDTFDVVEQYVNHQLPLDVFIWDMGWHLKHGGSGLGSGCGWSFDPQLFPNATQFLGELKEKGLHMGMNVHDCGGICSDEPLYAEAAAAVGVDPKTKTLLTAQWCTNPKFAHALGDIVNKGPLDQGADFYWNDWACSGPIESGNGDTSSGCLGGRSTPSFWTNRNRHTFHRRQSIAKGNTGATSDPTETRGFVMGRWGGMGSHRYPHGFSGDVVDVNWQTVAYQPYFTATAGNVLFGWWSHDLLGVKVGDDGHNIRTRAEAMELHVRILQWGAWSPVFRTHDRGASAGGCYDSHWPSQLGDCPIVKPWESDPVYLAAIRETMQDRARLMPYAYTGARTFYDDGLALLRPMYYEHPELEIAYKGLVKNPKQSMVGSAGGAGGRGVAPSPGPPPCTSCQNLHMGFDLSGGGARIQAIPNGQLPNMTAMSCCAVCDAIDECQAFVVALDVPEGSGATNCYLLTGAGGISRSPNRASGTKGSWPPKPPTPAPTPAGGGGDDLVQYYYGSSNMVVAPVLSPIDYKQTSMADKLVWLPPTLTADEAAAGATAPVGWVERASQRLHFLSGAMQTQGAKLKKLYTLNTVPVFIKSGAVIPTIPLVAGDLVGTAQRQYTSLIFSIYPGQSSGSGMVYEDDGATIGYLVDQSAKTTCSYTHDFATGKIKVTISTNGTYATLPATRDYTIKLLNTLPAASVGVVAGDALQRVPHRDAVRGTAGASTWHYDGDDVALVISLTGVTTSATTTIDVSLPTWPSSDRDLLNGMKGAIEMAKLAKLNMDEVRQNPGGQCCVLNVTAPLSDAAVWGTALTNLAAKSDLTAFQTKLHGFWGMYAGAQVELANLPNKSSTSASMLSSSNRFGNSSAAPSLPATTVAPIVAQRTHTAHLGGGPDKPPAPSPIKLVRLTYGRDLLASAYTTV